MSRDAAAKDFVNDAFAHCKFIGVGGNAEAIFVAAGISEDLGEACLPLAKAMDAATFIEACRELRFWPRELEVDMDAQPDRSEARRGVKEWGRRGRSREPT